MAAVSSLVGAGERAAYFLLREAEAFGTPGSGLGTPVRSGAPSLADTWQGALAARDLRLATMRAGTLRSLGVGLNLKKPQPDPDGVQVRPLPGCKFCKLGRLCGLMVIV